MLPVEQGKAVLARRGMGMLVGLTMVVPGCLAVPCSRARAAAAARSPFGPTLLAAPHESYRWMRPITAMVWLLLFAPVEGGKTSAMTHVINGDVVLSRSPAGPSEDTAWWIWRGGAAERATPALSRLGQEERAKRPSRSGTYVASTLAAQLNR